jgi:circadian clock protein KaiB
MTAGPIGEPAPEPDEGYQLTLFVSGASDLSARAIADARQLCDLHLSGRSRLTVIDVHAQPDAAVSSRVRAVPTLVKTRPLPVRRLVGDLSQTERVLSVLALARAEDVAEARP